MPNKKKLYCSIDSNDLINPHLQNFIVENCQELKITRSYKNYSVNSLNYKKIYNLSYSSKIFLKDLKIELKKHSEYLSKIFNKRLDKYSNSMLSELWKNNKNFIKYKSKYITRYPNYVIKSMDIQLLKDILIKRFKKKASKCIDIIYKYQCLEIPMNVFFQTLSKELGRISGEIPVSNKELSILFGYNERYLTDNFNSEIDKFTIESLRNFEENIKKLLHDEAQKCITLVNKYIESNSDLKLYSHQQFTISNPFYFHELDKLEKYYWLGFLFADGSLDAKEHRIKFKLKKDDGDRIDLFAIEVGLKQERVRDCLEFTRDKYGNIKYFTQRIASFGCRPMAEDLKNLGFLKFKKGEIGLPKYIISLIQKARDISNNLLKSKEGKFALAFLLGFYDGDGSYKGGKNAYIGNANKKFLIDIQNWYNSPNRIRLRVKGEENKKNIWSLTLGPDLFVSMCHSYENSMLRKKYNVLNK